MVVEVSHLQAPVGALCRIEMGRGRAAVLAEVVGFRHGRLLVMPYAEAQGLAPGLAVTALASRLTVPTGRQLLGRVLDGLGEPIDGGPPLGRLPRRPLGEPTAARP